MLLNREFRARGIVRSAFIIPWAIPAFVAALVWSWMFNDQFGILAALTYKAADLTQLFLLKKVAMLVASCCSVSRSVT